MPFETDKSGGFKIDASELLKTGVYPERFDRKIPFWETVDGVQYTEFGMRRKAGRSPIHDYKESPQSSNTPMRGLTATREYGTKVAYVADLNNIYSYVQSDSTASPVGSSSFNTVGSGYTLIRNSAGTTWDSSEALTITAAAITSGAISITTDSDHGLIPGESVTLSGLTGYSSPNPNATWTVSYPTGSGFSPSNLITIQTGTSKTETYGTSGSSLATLPETNWDNSSTSWDEAVNESDQWDFETFGSFVVGAKGSTKPVIKKNNVNFNTYHNDEVSGATVHVDGTANVVDDALTQASTTGSGSGLTVTVTGVDSGKLVDFKITNFGSGYVNNEVVTLTNAHSGTASQIKLTVPEIDFDSLECFHRQGPHMLAFNYSKGDVDYSTSFAWCSADDLDTWTAAATNTAGSLLIREAETPIRCVTQLGTNLAVYTETQMFLVSYVGLPNIFGYQVALEGSVGAVSPNSVVSVGRTNYGLSRDGFFMTDGASVKMIGRESGMNQYFRDNVSDNELAQVYAFENSKENECVWGIPKGGTDSINEEIYYNYKTGQWGIRTSRISAYLDRGIFHDALSADSNGWLYAEGDTPNLQDPDTAVNQPVSAITKAHDLNNADKIKEITAIRVGKEGSGSPRMSIGFSSTIDAEATYLDKDSFLIDDSFKSFPVRAAGRYIHIKVESSGSSDDWTLTDLVVQGRFEGER